MSLFEYDVAGFDVVVVYVDSIHDDGDKEDNRLVNGVALSH